MLPGRAWPAAPPTSRRAHHLRVSAPLRESIFCEHGGCGPGLPLSRENDWVRYKEVVAAPSHEERFARRRGGRRRALLPHHRTLAPQPPSVSTSCSTTDRKSTRLTPVTNAHLVCRLLLEKKK